MTIFTQENNKLWCAIINLAPDSFSDGKEYFSIENTLKKCQEFVEHGAKIIDFGGMASNPHVKNIKLSTEEELQRIYPHIKAARKVLPKNILFSVDTSSPLVAQTLAQENLIDIINDIYAAKNMEIINGIEFSTAHIAAKFNLALILMHMGKIPTNETSVLPIIKNFFIERINYCQNIGVKEIIIDPGIGYGYFGKELTQILEILSPNFIKQLKELQCQILFGVSRKTFQFELNKHLINPLTRDKFSKELELQCFKDGVDIIRTHILPSQLYHSRNTKYLSEPKSWNIYDISADNLLNLIIDRAKDVKDPICVFDLDGTLFDVSYRTLGIIQEWLKSAEAQEFNIKLLDSLSHISYHHMGYNLLHAFENFGFNLQDAEVLRLFTAIEKNWHERFFDGKTLLKYDFITPNSLDFIQKIDRHNIKIYYLTGRHFPLMHHGTLTQLKKYNFPLEIDYHNLLMKDNTCISDHLFKANSIQKLGEKFNIIANFENEYLNLAHMCAHIPNALNVIVDLPNSGQPVPGVNSVIYRIKNF